MSTYTPQEDEIIIQEISKSPNNLAYAFSEAAKKINRPATAISGRYYSKLKHTSKAMVLMTTQGAVINVKNTRRPDAESKSIAMEVAEFALQKLTRTEKVELAKRLMNE